MKFNLVALEETQHWDPEITNKTGRIFTVYAYNPEEATNCCEITPSYYLIPVDFFCENTLSDSLQESVYREWAIATDPFYAHCSTIDRMPEKRDGFLVRYESKNDFDDEDSALDYFQGNSFLG